MLLNLIPFQYREYDCEYIIKQSQQAKAIGTELFKEWSSIAALTNTGNQLVSVLVCYFVSDNISSFMLVMMTMQRLNGAVTNMMHFLTRYNTLYNDYNDLEEFWKDAEFKDQPKKMIPHKGLKVIDVNIRRGNFRLKMIGLRPSLAPGQKIYIEGKTGGGKSTLLKALFGHISGVKLNVGKPENYYHHVADYFQEIKEKFSSGSVSIRDYFKGEAKDVIIKKYLLRVFTRRELKKIMKNIGGYDALINEKLSGGEKSRVLLTLRGYEATVKNKGIIVLDEPCPDVDEDTYVEIMNRFFDDYADRTIIMIGHLCKCKKERLKIQWSQQYRVSNGFVTVIHK